MKTFGVSNSIKYLTIIVIALSLAFITAIILGLALHPQTPPTGNMDGSNPDEKNPTASTQMQTPARLEDTQNLEFLVDDDTMLCTFLP